MPDATTYLAFLAAVLAYQLAAPGPDMLLVASRGLGQGRRTALSTALGCVAAGIIQVPLLALGLASLVAASPLAYDLLRWLGAGYLIWLGLRLLCAGRRPGNESSAPAVSATSAHAAFWQGMICNLGNPTTLAFMLAILPQFADPGAGPVALQLVVLGTTMKATGIFTLGAVALASGALGGWLARRPGLVVWQGRFAGAAIVALGLHLLLAGGVRAR